ncbi:MAG: transcription termination/antitermination protein NusG [Clostridia bacterium]
MEINNENAKWYALHTFSNYENIAKINLEAVITKYGLEKRIFDIVIPMEDVIEEKNGKKKLVQRKLMPSYILVKMIYGDDIWHNVTRTKGVTGFVGPNGRPLSLTDEEVAKLRLERVVSSMVLEPNDKVEVIGGALAGMNGVVISADGSKAKVAIEMFGRESQLELEYCDLRKLNA